MNTKYYSGIKNRKKTARIGEELSFASKEAYNLLRTNISFAFPDQTGGRVLGVSSACPQEGKSTTSMNLAYSLADGGNKVLLIDADMRRPSVCFTLELEMSPGLSNVLAGNEDVKIHKAMMLDNLDIITSGDIPPNPSELIGSQRMKEFLDGCRQKYDYIIVDLPPVLSVADALALSKYIDGVIIVVRHNSARRKDVVETIRQLEFANAKVVGFVYNKIESRGHARYYKPTKYYKKA
ncbi:MAG: CpsD/CapB family tyrosine-protein kinase [Ruminococcaceae bacterium]|nr:CpsD/CapB family tyrosine-protein kinase [Oscillospiraceae bacterium]